jgi:hypothetical protein
LGVEIRRKIGRQHAAKAHFRGLRETDSGDRHLRSDCSAGTPVIVTCVPTAPLVGLKLRSCGRTRNGRLLVKVPLGVVTITGPVVAPVSIAFRPFRDNKTVFRAGFGIFTVINLGQLQNNNELNHAGEVFATEIRLHVPVPHSILFRAQRFSYWDDPA